MRASLTIPCEGETLMGTLDTASGTSGVLIVTGGRQTRVGPHRMMADLAGQLAAEGHPVFRFDRRGTGDSSGTDSGFRGSAADIAAAIEAFRAACPNLQRLWGLGLCDGATALSLHHGTLAIDGLILLNPWVIEADAGSPSPEAIRSHYREQLTTLSGWRKLLTRGFRPMAAIRGLRRAIKRSDQGLASDVMTSLDEFQGPVHILLAERDATARGFISALGGQLRAASNVTLSSLDSASHSFAPANDKAWLQAALQAALKTA